MLGKFNLNNLEHVKDDQIQSKMNKIQFELEKMNQKIIDSMDTVIIEIAKFNKAQKSIIKCNKNRKQKIRRRNSNILG